MRSMPGTPWDGHTLEETIEQVSILTDRKPNRFTRWLKAMIKRRSAIEPTIGHMKTDGRWGSNPLKSALGGALHAVPCGAGHNIRRLMKKLRLLWPQILEWLHGHSQILEIEYAAA